MDFTLDDIRKLYGEQIFLVPDENAPAKQPESLKETKTPVTKVKPAQEPVAKTVVVVPETEEKGATEVIPQETPNTLAQPEPTEPGITWKPKEKSKVLFVLYPKEFKNKKLTNLLKDIVGAMQIPFDDAGFGTLEGPIGPIDWEAMPNPFAVIFDTSLNSSGQNPLVVGNKKIFFAAKLADLEASRDLKKELWKHLQVIMNEM